MSIDLQSISDRLSEFGQQHLLQAAAELSDADLESLITSINTIDLDLIHKLTCNGTTDISPISDAAIVGPPNALRLTDENLHLASGEVISRCEAVNAGEALLNDHALGVIVVAGGQGTRLGFDHPKGMYPIGELSERSLFQFVTDKIKALSSRYGYCVPLFIMTSPPVHDDTVKFFVENSNFGLSEDQLFFFCQGTMPAVDQTNGKILMQSKSELCLSPNGHGGMLSALKDSGVLVWCREHNISTLFYSQIDNPLSQIGDPLLLGVHRLSDADVSMQVIEKQHADDRTGNVVLIDDITQMIEYSEMPGELAAQTTTNTNGEEKLRFWASNIAVHTFSTDFLLRMSEDADALPFHLAAKTVRCLENGELVSPTVPNAYKFEQFIFDLLPHAQNTMVVEVERSVAFAPVKNAPEATFSTVATSRATMNELYRRWLTETGCKVNDSAVVEINARFALDQAQLQLRELPEQIDADTYFQL